MTTRAGCSQAEIQYGYKIHSYTYPSFLWCGHVQYTGARQKKKKDLKKRTFFSFSYVQCPQSPPAQQQGDLGNHGQSNRGKWAWVFQSLVGTYHIPSKYAGLLQGDVQSLKEIIALQHLLPTWAIWRTIQELTESPVLCLGSLWGVWTSLCLAVPFEAQGLRCPGMKNSNSVPT